MRHGFSPKLFPIQLLVLIRYAVLLNLFWVQPFFLFNNQKINEAPYESVMIAFPQNIAD